MGQVWTFCSRAAFQLWNLGITKLNNWHIFKENFILKRCHFWRFKCITSLHTWHTIMCGMSWFVQLNSIGADKSRRMNFMTTTNLNQWSFRNNEHVSSNIHFSDVRLQPYLMLFEALIREKFETNFMLIFSILAKLCP